MQLPVWKERGSKAFYSLLDIKSPLETIDLLSINESNPHNGDLPSPQNIHVLTGKALSKTKTNIFSTVGPWGLFRPFLLLRARKTDIRGEPGYMCCVRKVTSTHLGVEILVTQKVRKFKFPQPLKPHSPTWRAITSSFMMWLRPPSRPPGSWNSLGSSHALPLGLKADWQPLTNLPQAFYKNPRLLTLCIWGVSGSVCN